MWFEERSWSNLRMSDLVEEWRDLWSFKVDFIATAIAYVFATTNFLNLPRLILENGGLAFLSAYGAALLVLVLPTIVLELAVGQLTGRAPVLAFFNLSPIFKGVGVSQILFTIIVLATMTKFLGWLVIYLYYLIWTIANNRTGLPWLNCAGFPEILSQPCREAGSMANFSTTTFTKMSTVRAESSLMQFMAHIEQPSETIISGDFEFFILAAQGAIWIGVFCTICFGVRWLGKLVPLFFMMAFAVLLGFDVRACTLGGLTEIFDAYLKSTDWNRLADYQMWKVAVEQAILATGIGFGAFITFGSYNKRSNNLVLHSVLVVFGHIMLSAMQVIAVIGLVGYVSLKTGLEPLQILDKGESQMWHILAYLSYIPNLKIWTFCILGISIVVLFNIFSLLSLSVLATFEDAMGEKWSRCFPRFFLAFVVCALTFGLSAYYSTHAGRHAYELVTGFLKYITIFVILAFELLATSWFYCAHRLGRDLHVMLKTKCCWCFGHFLLFFTYLLPAVPAAIAVLNAMKYDFSTFSPAIHSWEWSEYCGFAIAIVPLLPIPLYFWIALLKACCCRDKAGHSKGERLKLAITSQTRREEKHVAPPRYVGSAPGYLLLPQAPLAEPETYA